jgi:uncharacterized protein
MESRYDSDKRKLLSAVCHGFCFMGLSVVSIGVPIAIMLVSDDPVVKDNAKESINMHLNIWLIGGILLFFLGIPLLNILLWPIFGPILFVYTLLLPGWAVFKSLTEPDVAHRYPFIFRLPL